MNNGLLNTEGAIVKKLERYKPVFISIGHNHYILRDDNVHRDTLLRVDFDSGKIFYYNSDFEYIMKLLKKKMTQYYKESRQRYLDFVNLNALLDKSLELLEEK